MSRHNLQLNVVHFSLWLNYCFKFTVKLYHLRTMIHTTRYQYILNKMKQKALNLRPDDSVQMDLRNIRSEKDAIITRRKKIDVELRNLNHSITKQVNKITGRFYIYSRSY